MFDYVSVLLINPSCIDFLIQLNPFFIFVLIVQAKLSLRFSFHFPHFMTFNPESLLYNQGKPPKRSVKQEHPKK